MTADRDEPRIRHNLERYREAAEQWRIYSHRSLSDCIAHGRPSRAIIMNDMALAEQSHGIAAQRTPVIRQGESCCIASISAARASRTSFLIAR